ncbi:hypothetical protein [Thermoleptolyngbya sp. M55_K2018_002]|uniref:hypothetical protein n=1 Tax=Thermoleptolyngbya sp. M55_K2018_002 TaxID=2747808 RepID=UPI0019DA8D9B|nr:hypothetical protein [Thermoleptolyngbya sp. M55_K2018_002]HIK39775.1 hypothetical protein [Thermoleptolyngbya sp. M55_K2018_002]
MIHRFSRLLQPAALLGFALITLAGLAGIEYSLNSHLRELQRGYRVDPNTWQTYSAEVRAIVFPDVVLMPLVGYAAALLLSPEPGKGDRAAVRRLARRKLSGDVLTQDELEFWARVEREVSDVENLR